MAAEVRKRHSSVSKTTQEIADRVNDSLPIQVHAPDVEKNPEFVKLLHSLSQHLTPEGCSVSTQSDLSEAEQVLKHEKYKWLQQQILYQELQELLLDQDLQSTGPATPGGSIQFYRAVKECLSMAEIGDYLDCNPDPGTGITLLGLNKEDLQRRNPHRKHMQSIQQKLIPEIEARLRKKCEALVNFHDSSSTIKADNGSFTFAKATQLPAVLEAEKQSLNEERKQLKRDKYNRKKQFWQYYKALMDSLSVLEHLIQKHRLESQCESDTITAEWLMARCDAMCLKIKLLEMQILCDTYYAETVVALSKIRGHLDSATGNTQQELGQVTQALKAYEAVGLGFDNLVREYTYLRDEVDNKRWALRELKHNLVDLPT